MYQLGPRRHWPPRKKTILIIFGGTLALALIGILIYQIPRVQEYVDWRLDDLRARIKYAISPPEEVVFAPDPTLVAMVEETMAAFTPTATSTATTSPTHGPTSTPEHTSTPVPSPTSIPDQILLSGIQHEYQKRNNCGPATLAMALTFWGWEGDQRDTAAILKPLPTDKNVMPYELEDFVVNDAGLKVAVRYAGDLEVLKRVIAAGFPVIIEKGLDHKDGWVGHYQLLAGYDDGQGHFNAYDSLNGDFTEGKTLIVPYETVETHWLAFNYTYIVIYPDDREADVAQILGSDMDETSNLYKAADKASIDIFNLTGQELFFSWYNRGTSLMRLTDYGGAAQAYDEAFRVYAAIEPAERPWRILWYQTGPYFAYYFTGRYYDVINLADQTLDLMPDPVLEESYYWRALAKEALGDIDGAIADLQTSLIHHPDFEPSLYQLNRLGVST
jgi:hypothetical protein